MHTRRCTSILGKMETLVWTRHMDDCLDVLERENDQPQDEVLVAVVRAQLVNEDVQKLLRRQGSGDNGQGPTHIHKAGLVARLEQLRQRLPERLHTHRKWQSPAGGRRPL